MCVLLRIRLNGSSCEDGTGYSASTKDRKFLDHTSVSDSREELIHIIPWEDVSNLRGNSITRCLDMQDTQTLCSNYILTSCNEYKSYIKMRIHCDCSLGNNQACSI